MLGWVYAKIRFLSRHVCIILFPNKPIVSLVINLFYYMAFQNSLFWLVDKRWVKTHIQTVVRIFRIWTGVPDVVYLAGSFKLCIVVFLDVSPLQTCVSLKFTDKNFKQPNCFWLSIHAYRILLPSETDDSRFNSREKHMLICSQTQFSHIINRLLTSLVRSVLWNIRPLFFAWTSLLRRSVHTKNLGLIFHSTDLTLGQ